MDVSGWKSLRDNCNAYLHPNSNFKAAAGGSHGFEAIGETFKHREGYLGMAKVATWCASVGFAPLIAAGLRWYANRKITKGSVGGKNLGPTIPSTRSNQQTSGKGDSTVTDTPLKVTSFEEDDDQTRKSKGSSIIGVDTDYGDQIEQMGSWEALRDYFVAAILNEDTSTTITLPDSYSLDDEGVQKLTQALIAAATGKKDDPAAFWRQKFQEALSDIDDSTWEHVKDAKALFTALIQEMTPSTLVDSIDDGDKELVNPVLVFWDYLVGMHLDDSDEADDTMEEYELPVGYSLNDTQKNNLAQTLVEAASDMDDAYSFWYFALQDEIDDCRSMIEDEGMSELKGHFKDLQARILVLKPPEQGDLLDDDSSSSSTTSSTDGEKKDDLGDVDDLTDVDLTSSLGVPTDYTGLAGLTDDSEFQAALDTLVQKRELIKNGDGTYSLAPNSVMSDTDVQYINFRVENIKKGLYQQSLSSSSTSTSSSDQSSDSPTMALVKEMDSMDHGDFVEKVEELEKEGNIVKKSNGSYEVVGGWYNADLVRYLDYRMSKAIKELTSDFEQSGSSIKASELVKINPTNPPEQIMAQYIHMHIPESYGGAGNALTREKNQQTWKTVLKGWEELTGLDKLLRAAKIEILLRKAESEAGIMSGQKESRLWTLADLGISERFKQQKDVLDHVRLAFRLAKIASKQK